MMFEELYKLNNKILTPSELDILWENEAIESIENLGSSGFYLNKIWYVVNLINGTNINVYV